MCLNDGADMIGALRPEGRLSRKISLNAARLVKLRSHDRLLFSNGEGTLLYSEGSLRFAVDDTLTASFQISNLLHFKYKIGSKFVYRDGIDLKDKEFDLNRKETTLHFEGHPQLIFLYRYEEDYISTFYENEDFLSNSYIACVNAKTSSVRWQRSCLQIMTDSVLY